MSFRDLKLHVAKMALIRRLVIMICAINIVGMLYLFEIDSFNFTWVKNFNLIISY